MKQVNLKIPLTILSFLIVVCLYSCKTLNPQKPNEHYIKQTTNTLPLSQLHIPINISLDLVQKNLNNELKGLIYEDSSLTNNQNDNLLLKVWKRDNIKIHMHEELLHITVPIKVWSLYNVDLSSLGFSITKAQKLNFSLDLHFTMKPSIDEYWKWQTETLPNGFNWIEEPKIKLGPFNVSLSGLIEDLLREQQVVVANVIDKTISYDNTLKKYATLGWSQLQTSFPIDNDSSAWLNISPLLAKVNKPVGTGKNVSFIIALEGYVELTTKNEKKKTKTELPKLISSDSIPKQSAIFLENKISYKEINRYIKEEWLKEPYTYTHGKRNISIDNIETYGQDERLIFKVDVSDDLNGIIYLSGVPYYNTDSKSYKMGQMEYDLDTKNKLAKLGGWLLKSKFTKALEENINIPIGDKIDTASHEINRLITHYPIQKNLFLEGQLVELSPSTVSITSSFISTTFELKGTLGLNYDNIQ